MTRHSRTAVIAIVCFMCLAACDSRSFGNDEGVYLAQRIGDAAEKLRASSDTMAAVEYSPNEGIDQRYTVGIGASKWCPDPPCDPGEQSGLTVHVERGNSGSTTVHKRYVAIPAALHLERASGRTNVFLRKNGDVIEVVAIR